MNTIINIPAERTVILWFEYYARKPELDHFQFLTVRSAKMSDLQHFPRFSYHLCPFEEPMALFMK